MSSGRPFALALLAACALVGASPGHAAPEAAPEWPHQLTLFSIPSPHGMDWSSPRALGISGVKNKIEFQHFGHKHAIGHVFIQLEDPSLEEPILTGMTTVSQEEEISLALQRGYGLGVLAASMHGKLDQAAKLRDDMTKRYQTGAISWVRYLLSPELGARLVRYFREYRERGYDRFYGGSDRPRYGEGGGCSAFGVSFVDVAGLMEPEYQESWKVLLRIPARLFGGPRTHQSVPLRRLFAYGRWAEEGEPHAKIEMWDPSLIHDWVVRTWDAEREAPTGRWQPETRRRARGLLVDARARAVPQEPIWLRDAPGAPHPYARQGGSVHEHRDLPGSTLAVPTLFVDREASAARVNRAPAPRPPVELDLAAEARRAIP